MNLKSVAVVTVAVLATLACYDAKLLDEGKLRSNLKKINTYLLKNVKTEEAEPNLAAVRKWLKDKASSPFKFLESVGLLSALALTSLMAEGPLDGEQCHEMATRKMRLCKYYDLVEEQSPKGVETTLREPMTRITRILEHYAVKDARRCKSTMVWARMMNSDYKQSAYDRINDHLTKALPDSSDAEANFAEAEKMLSDLKSKDSAMADAIKQFLALKSMATVESCTDEGDQILFRNQLASRYGDRKTKGDPLGRAGEIFEYFAMEHEQVCRPTVVGRFKSALKKLDAMTYRLVLGLVSSHYSHVGDYDKLAEELKHKEVDEDFSTSLVVDFWQSKLSSLEDTELVKPDKINRLEVNKLVGYMRAAAKALPKDPEEPYAENSKRLREKLDYGSEVMKMFIQYLYEPCGHFLEVFEEKVELDENGEQMNPDHVGSAKSKFFDELTYHTVRAGYYACKNVFYDFKYIFERMGRGTRNQEGLGVLEEVNLSHVTTPSIINELLA